MQMIRLDSLFNKTFSTGRKYACVVFIVLSEWRVITFRFLFSLAEKQINYHTTSSSSYLFLFHLLALCRIHIISHISSSVVL